MTSPTDDAASEAPPAASLPTEPPPHRRTMRTMVIAAAAALGLVLGVLAVNLGDDDTSESGPGPVESRAAGASVTAPPSGDGTEIAVEQLDSTGAVRIDVSDPAAPTATGATSRVCVLVTYTMALDSADETGLDRQTHGCADPGGSATLSIDPLAPAVGCAAVADRQSVEADGSTAVTATFTVTPAAPLQIGPFEVQVDAVTGFGDGCPPADDQGEHVATEAVGINVG